jgi:hypothetical protein
MKVLRCLNFIFFQIGMIERVCWNIRIEKIMKNRRDEVSRVRRLTVIGSSSEMTSVLDALIYIERKSVYFSRLIKGYSLLIVFENRDLRHMNSLVRVIFLDRDKGFSKEKIAAYLIFKAVRMKCQFLDVPKTWISRTRIYELGIKSWEKVLRGI